ncbi:MAG: hypothetical protein WCP65_00090 [Bacteroidota bacterium]
MANTITNTRLLANEQRVIQYICIASDGTQETNTIIYNSSAVATAIGIADPLKSTIIRARYVSNAALGVVNLDFDASTKVLALAMPYNGYSMDMNFKDIGGLKNTAGTGITGNILLTTTGLASGNKITLILEVRPN